MASRLRKLKLKDLPLHERPRERLLKSGPENLSDSELLALILGTGSKKESVLGLSNRILSKYDLLELSALSSSESARIFGIGDAKTGALVAAFKLGRRMESNSHAKDTVSSPADIALYLMPGMRRLKREVLKCICLDSKAHILKHANISVGNLNTNSVQPREVFPTAIAENAAAIILVHNHPSGDPTPSKADIVMTQRLAKAGNLLGIELLDHVIIGDGKYVSLREGKLF